MQTRMIARRNAGYIIRARAAGTTASGRQNIAIIGADGDRKGRACLLSSGCSPFAERISPTTPRVPEGHVADEADIEARREAAAGGVARVRLKARVDARVRDESELFRNACAQSIGTHT